MNERFIFLPIVATLLLSGCATSTLLTAPNSRPANQKRRLVDQPGVVPALLPFALALDIATSPLIPLNLAVAEANRAIKDAPLNEAQVIKLSNATAEKKGYKLAAYGPPKTSYKYAPKDGSWSVFYEGKGKLPGNHFIVTVHDKTKKTELMPGE